MLQVGGDVQSFPMRHIVLKKKKKKQKIMMANQLCNNTFFFWDFFTIASVTGNTKM